MTDPDVRVVVEGLRRWERELERLFRRRDVVIHLTDEVRQALVSLDRDLKRLETKLRSGP